MHVKVTSTFRYASGPIVIIYVPSFRVTVFLCNEIKLDRRKHNKPTFPSEEAFQIGEQACTLCYMIGTRLAT